MNKTNNTNHSTHSNYAEYLDTIFSKLSSKYAAMYVSLNSQNDPMLTEIQCIHRGKGYNIRVQTPVSDIRIGDFYIAAVKTSLEVITILNNKG